MRSDFASLILLVISVFSGIAHALDYGSSIENTDWAVSGSVFECRFEQQMPGYGTAVFYHQAGEDVQFRLETLRNLMDHSQASISIMPPPWQPSNKSQNLGTATIVKRDPNLTLDSKRTNQFLHALLEGQWPAISHYTYYDQSKFIDLHVSAVSFKDHYPKYMECANQLLRVNFKQVENSKVLFGPGEHTLDPLDKRILDDIIYYIKNDPRVFAVYLDGHTDNTGRRFQNREISRARVERVEQYLLDHDINQDMITTRFHGDRYPIASNATTAGQAQNRRVTIQLKWDEDQPVPEELVFRSKL